MYRILGSFPWDQIRTWSDLESVIARLESEHDRGEAFEEFCHAFFELQSQLYQIKDVWRFRNIPAVVLERLGTNTKQDKGIDGVLLHEDGTITAYQAKFRIDHSSTPSQREVSTFYMVSDRADYRLIISNVDDLPVVIKERKDHGQILVDKLLDLDHTFFSQLADLLHGTSAPVKPTPVPRSYQAEALTNIVTGLNNFGRGQAILACGAGKTLIGKWVCDSLECDSALVMVPSLALIRQTLGEWHRANTKPFRYLCVCSDSTVDSQSDDSWVVNPSDLDCRVTTSPADVAFFLRSDSLKTRVIFCTYQSGEVLVAALRSEALSNFAFDLAICDEAHRLAGLSTKTFNHILSDDSIRARRRLFMTATPKILEPRLKDTADEDQAEVFSMDDESIFGPVLYRFGFQRAIQEQVICDYQIVVIGVSEEEANRIAPGSEVLKTTNSGRWSIEGLAQRIALGKAISTYGIQKIFSFHSRVDAASRFVDGQLPDSFTSVMKQIAPKTDFLASHISGVMSSGVRAKKLRDFETANRGVIANAKCLGEGVNVPVVDGVFFSDPKDSIIEIVQATGRALRRKQNKETAYVMIPVLIRTGEDPETVLRSSRFNSVWKVLSAMSSQDDRLQSTIAQAGVSKGENGDATTARDGATGVRGLPDYRTVVMGFPADLPLYEYQRLFTLEAVEKTGDRWFVRFGALKRYVETHGEEPTATTEFQGINLGTWLTSQRKAFRENKLAPDKLKLITTLGVSLSGRRDKWERQLIACKAFLEINDRLPSIKDVSTNGIKIGEWLSHQRAFYRKNKLPKEKVERFEQLLGPVWDPMADRWNRNFDAYRDYVVKTGKQPTRRTEHNGVNIGVWRIYLRKNSCLLSQDQIDSLNAVGMNVPLDAKRDGENRDRISQDQKTHPNAAWKWFDLIPELGRKNQGRIDSLDAVVGRRPYCDAELRRKFSGQADDDWFQYYLWCKESAKTGVKILSKVPDERKQDVDEWFQVQSALYRDKKLPADRRRYFEILLYSKSR